MITPEELADAVFELGFRSSNTVELKRRIANAIRKAKAEAYRDASDIAQDHCCSNIYEFCDCSSKITREIYAKLAAIEKEVVK